MNHDHLRAAILRAFPESRLTPVSEQNLDTIRVQHPDAPESYLAFLREVGAGRIGRDNLALYDGLCLPGEIYDPTVAAELEGVLIFGDNFSGECVGFDTRNGWCIVWIDYGDLLPPPGSDETFGEFVAQWVAGYAE
jgi:hypothetical protein